MTIKTNLAALATLRAGNGWTLHANLGTENERSSATTPTLLNLAVARTPSEHALVFAETPANNKSAVFGGVVNTAGARWWLAKDRSGVDLTASRQADAAIGALWTLGFGWYGLAFF